MIRCTIILALIAWPLGVAVAADIIEGLETTYGPRDVRMVSGAGGLTVGVNGRGRVTLCKWPSPGYDDQLGYRTRSRDEASLGALPGHGLIWGMRIGGELVWLDDARWEITQRYDAPTNTIMVTEARWPGTDIAVRQQVSVQARGDTFLWLVDVEGMDSIPQLYWYANFSPCTRHLPEVPVADWLLDGLNDFAAFTAPDDDMVVHFRPRSPGREDWRRAGELVGAFAGPSRWQSFREGVWIGYTALEGIQSAHCGSGEVSPSQAIAQLPRSIGRVTSARGQCYSAVQILPLARDGGHRASVVVSFGRNYEEMREGLDAVKGVDPGSLLEEIAEFQRTFARMNTYPGMRDRRVGAYLRRSAMTILSSTDVETGSRVRSPVIQPPLARDWPKYGAWMIYALDLSGAVRAAERQLKFYAGRIRTEYIRGKPIGSLPASTYTDGVPSSPHVIVDDEAVAWFLWALHEHGAFVGTRRAEYFASIWEGVVLSADFLAAWKDGRRGAPLWSEEPITLRDSESRERLFAAKLGLDGAAAIARELGEDVPRLWSDRQRQVDDLIRGLLLGGELRWPVGDSLPMFLGEFGEADEELVDDAVARRLAALEDLSGYDAAKAFCDAALVWRGRPEKLAELKPYAHVALRNALTAPSRSGVEGEREPLMPDALVAALCLVAAHTVYGAGE